MSHDLGLVCKCVSEHRPAPLELHIHHIVPLYAGGPDVDENRVPVCPTTHVNTHELLRAMERLGRVIPFGEFVVRYEQPVSRYAHTLAVLGYTLRT